MKIIKGTALSVLAAATLLSSCNVGCFPAQTDPDTSRFDNGYTSYSNDDTAEQDYSNIIAFTDKQEYPTTFDKITVTIKNENPGKGFYFFSIPVIEYNDKGEWKRLNYSPESYEIPEQWALCAILDDTERQFSTAQSIYNDRLKGSWNPGEYRAVVFVRKETVYAPFAIIDT